MFAYSEILGKLISGMNPRFTGENQRIKGHTVQNRPFVRLFLALFAQGQGRVLIVKRARPAMTQLVRKHGLLLRLTVIFAVVKTYHAAPVLVHQRHRAAFGHTKAHNAYAQRIRQLIELTYLRYPLLL